MENPFRMGEIHPTPQHSHHASFRVSFTNRSSTHAVCHTHTLDVFPTNGHRYTLTPFELTYSQAVRYAARLPKCCGGKAAHLVTITSSGENVYVGQVVSPFCKLDWFDRFGPGRYVSVGHR